MEELSTGISTIFVEKQDLFILALWEVKKHQTFSSDAVGLYVKSYINILYAKSYIAGLSKITYYWEKGEIL